MRARRRRSTPYSPLSCSSCPPTSVRLSPSFSRYAARGAAAGRGKGERWTRNRRRRHGRPMARGDRAEGQRPLPRTDGRPRCCGGTLCARSAAKDGALLIRSCRPPARSLAVATVASLAHGERGARQENGNARDAAKSKHDRFGSSAIRMDAAIQTKSFPGSPLIRAQK